MPEHVQTLEPVHPQHDGNWATYQKRAHAKYAARTNRMLSPWAVITATCEYPQCLRVRCMKVLEPVKLAYEPGQCTYCGEPGGTMDHLMPRAWTGERFRRQVAIVPACAHCNSTINDSWAISVSERREICHARLRKNNKRLLESPDRTDEELDQLGYVMRQSAESYAIKKARLLARLSWPPDPDYDRRAFEKSGIYGADELGLE